MDARSYTQLCASDIFVTNNLAVSSYTRTCLVHSPSNLSSVVCCSPTSEEYAICRKGKGLGFQLDRVSRRPTSARWNLFLLDTHWYAMPSMSQDQRKIHWDSKKINVCYFPSTLVTYSLWRHHAKKINILRSIYCVTVVCTVGLFSQLISYVL